jgi:hypothetical protein
MNLVYMSYADFCALAGGEGQQESVRVVLQVRASLPIMQRSRQGRAAPDFCWLPAALAARTRTGPPRRGG